MEIRTRDNGGFLEVAISGEMNIYGALDIKAALVKAIEESDGVVLDLSGVSGFDSAGAQLLLLGARESMNAGKKFTVSARSREVESVLGLLNLSGRVESAGGARS